VNVKMTNDCYTIVICGKTWSERYYREETGWIKVSARRRKFKATAEQVLNHLLPALAGIKANLTVKVEHHEPASKKAESGKRRSGMKEGTATRGINRQAM
jgi:hypothetical protein